MTSTRGRRPASFADRILPSRSSAYRRWLVPTLLRSRLVHLAVVLTALVWLFEFVPKAVTEQPSILALPFAERALSSLSNVENAIYDRVIKPSPSWLGLWNVYQPTGEFHPLAPSAEEVRTEAFKTSQLLRELRERTFFRIFKVDLTQQCPFWAREDLCSSPSGSCGVCECTDDEIPTHWRQRPIEHFVNVNDEVTPWHDERTPLTGDLDDDFKTFDGSFGSAENAFLDRIAGDSSRKASYVDLQLNPPGFTSYKGRNIWQLIYKENCLRSKEDQAAMFSKDDPEYQPSCSDEDVYERMISGLQTVIMVLSSEYNQPYEHTSYWRNPFPLFTSPADVNPETLPRIGTSEEALAAYDRLPNRYRYNLNLFRWRVNLQPKWVDNLYLDFSLLLRTVSRLSGIVGHCGCYTGTDAEDLTTQQHLSDLVEFAQRESASGQPRFANMPIFTRKQSQALQQMHNISRIFDCIECEKCRLHGKVKLTALQVAIKTLASPTQPGYQKIDSLERNEITALITALGYYADAIKIVSKMHTRVLALRRLLVTAALWSVVGVITAARHFQRERRHLWANVAGATTLKAQKEA